MEHTLEQLFVLADNDVITTDMLADKFHIAEAPSGEFSLPAGGVVLEDLEQDFIRQALDRTGGRIKEARGPAGVDV